MHSNVLDSPPQTCQKFANFGAKPVRAIIFDCDGTLVDSEHAYFLSLQTAFESYGVALCPSEYSQFVGQYVSIDSTFISRKIGRNCGEKVLEHAHALYYQKLDAGLPPIQHTYDFLHRLAEQKDELGIKLGLASAADKKHILANLKQLNIEHFFDVILSGKDDLDEYIDPEGVNKPKPYIYWEAAKALKLSPTECVAIEDSYTGIKSSVDAGCFTVAIPNMLTQGQNLSLAHLTISSLENLLVEEFFELIDPLRNC